MKKLKTQYIILTLITAYFLLNGLIPRKEEISVQYGQNTFYSWESYANDLHEEGYSKESAEHIAKVELKIIPSDAYYTALMED